MTFGKALEALKEGFEVYRRGWNGKGMSIKYIKGRTILDNHDRHEEYLPFIQMKTVDGKFVPWLASQTDILAEDYSIVE